MKKFTYKAANEKYLLTNVWDTSKMNKYPAIIYKVPVVRGQQISGATLLVEGGGYLSKVPYFLITNNILTIRYSNFFHVWRLVG